MNMTNWIKKNQVEVFMMAEAGGGHQYIADWLNRKAKEKKIKLDGKINKGMVNHFLSANKDRGFCFPESVVLMRSQWTPEGLRGIAV